MKRELKARSRISERSWRQNRKAHPDEKGTESNARG